MQVSRARFGAEVVVTHPVSCPGPQDTAMTCLVSVPSLQVSRRIGDNLPCPARTIIHPEVLPAFALPYWRFHLK